MKAIRHTRRSALRSLAVLASTILLIPPGLSHAAPLIPPSLLTPFQSAGADWMGNMAGQIGNTPLNNLVIPGTHDSGTYGISARSAPSPDDQSPTCASFQADVDGKVTSSVATVINNAISNVCDPIIGAISAEWAKAQDENLFAQLDGGVRYLDIRVCPPQNNSGPLMICHGIYSTDLPSALNQIKTFAQAHPKEIILANFSPLTENGGYNPSGDQPSYATLDSETAQQIESSLAGVLLKPSGVTFTSTMNQLWAAGGSVIALDSELPSDGSAAGTLWDASSLINGWADVDDAPDQVSDDLQMVECRCNSISGHTQSADPKALFQLYLNSTPDQSLIESSLLDLIDQASNGALGLNIPGLGTVMSVIRSEEGWPNNPPDSLQDMATRGERVGPQLFEVGTTTSRLRPNFNIIATDFIEQSSLVQMALALDAGGRIYGPMLETNDTYIVPSGVQNVRITAVGGSGSGGPNYLDPNSGPGHHGGIGGRGAVVSAVAPVQPGQKLYLWVGQNGRADGFESDSLPSYPDGGCGQFIQVNSTTGGCGFSSGGAASYVATAADSSAKPAANTLLLVAGGGGAGAKGGVGGAGGNGGDAGPIGGNGYNGSNGNGSSSACVGVCYGGYGHGGTQSQGGSQGDHQPKDNADCNDTRTAGSYLDAGYDDGNGGGGGGGGAGGAAAGAFKGSCTLAGGGGGGGGSSYVAGSLSGISSGFDPNVSGTPHPGWVDEQRGNPYIIITPMVTGAN